MTLRTGTVTDHSVSSVALYRCCALPVTLLPACAAPVFGKREVYRPGDAPKATRSPLSEERFGKGICEDVAQAHDWLNLDVNRIVEDFCINTSAAVVIIGRLWFNVNRGGFRRPSFCIVRLWQVARSGPPRKIHRSKQTRRHQLFLLWRRFFVWCGGLLFQASGGECCKG